MPTGKDGERTARILSSAGLACAVCKDINALCAEVTRGAGTALLTEEAIAAKWSGCLATILKEQPAWSDIPLVVLAREGVTAAPVREAMNAILVERPVKMRSLVSVVRAALRARRRQYEVRDYLAEREEHVESVRASEERFRFMADAVPVLVWLSDQSKGCTWFNKSWLDFAGRPMHELVSNGWADDVHPDDMARCLDIYNTNFDARRPFTMEYRLRRHDGEYRWVEDNGIPRFDGEGVFGGYIGSCVDFTDRKLAGEALRQLSVELSEADRKKDDFIALLAHELRNPLAPIRNGLQVLKLSGQGDRAVGMMDRQLSHMVRLIDDLLDVSRIGRNKMDLRREQVALTEVVASAVEAAQPAIDAAGHDLTVSLPGSPIFLDADLTRLAQVFSNLLTNSAKYTHRGGKVWLTGTRNGGSVSVSVRDTGIGIPAAALPSIFDMFSQVDRSIERSTGGLGIGLALVKGLTEMHGGTVTVESAGQGTTFTVTLPVLSAPPQIAVPVKAAAVQNGPAHRILVVDDNRDGAESLSQLLEVLGHQVTMAFDGVQAVEQAEEFRPDLILMDVGMPRLNGYEATRKIREHDWGACMTIIALTGWGQDGDRNLSQEAGCNGHLVKPVGLSDLERKLAELKGEKRLS
jgi:PAS domain S-box-containing protein